MARSRRAVHVLGRVSGVFVFGCLAAALTVLPVVDAASNARYECNANGQSEAIGINVNNLNWSSLANANLISAAKLSGAGWVRINIYWRWTERQPGKIDWQPIDTGLANLQAAHLNALITLIGPTPCWAMEKNAPGCTAGSSPVFTVPPKDLWLKFVTSVVTRYHTKVHYWEIWNEPDLIQFINLPDPTARITAYRNQILIPTAQTIRGIDPALTIIGGVFAAIPTGGTTPGPDLQNKLASLLAAPVPSLINAVSFHSYYPYHPADTGKIVRQSMRSAGMGEDALYVTEFGAEGPKIKRANPRADSKKAQADYLDNEVKQAIEGGIVNRMFWFALTDSPKAGEENRPGDHDRNNDFGLVDNDDFVGYKKMTPRNSYIKLQDMIVSACGKLKLQ
jgi:hypothetical protein